MRCLFPIVLVTLMPAVASAQAQQASGPTPRYLPAMESELATMGISASCRAESATRATCDYAGRSSLTERGLKAHASYSDETDTIYFHVADLLEAPLGAAATPAVLARLMELNWELLGCKLEWNPRTGEVRLSAVMHTDSNFDRRAFRSLVISLDTAAARYHAELAQLSRQLSEGSVHEATPAKVREEASGHRP